MAASSDVDCTSLGFVKYAHIDREHGVGPHRRGGLTWFGKTIPESLRDVITVVLWKD